MEFSAVQISQLINGKVEGNANELVNKLSKIEEGEKGSLSFLANPKYLPYIYTTNASVVIVSTNFAPEKPVSCTRLNSSH